MLRFPLFFFLSLLWIPTCFSAEVYSCPMHCEGQKTYSKPGTCPVCGMKLEKQGEPAAPPLNSRAYRVDLSTEPATLIAGKPAELTLSPRSTKDGSAVTGSKIDVTLVSQDLHWMSQLDADDAGKVKTLFPDGGNYLVYAGFTPQGAQKQIFPLPIQVDGKKKKEIPLKLGPTDAALGKGLQVKFKAAPAFKTGETILPFQIRRQGKPSTASDPHCLLISEDTTQFIFVEGRMADGVLGCPVHLHRSGLYKVWVQFSEAGKPHTVGFVVDIQ